ncbi:hypothetical protein ACIQHU_26345 [Streptomyces tendae]|uniref:hypothetical protein n=1 Tax=Streptomyces tendae TaxID=1932 RepID=UPI00380BE4BB
MTDQRRARAFNAVGPALSAHDQWLPLSVRQAVADAVLDALDEAAPAATQATGQVKTSPPFPYPREVAEDEAPMREYLRADQHQPKEQS